MRSDNQSSLRGEGGEGRAQKRRNGEKCEGKK